MGTFTFLLPPLYNNASLHFICYGQVFLSLDMSTSSCYLTPLGIFAYPVYN